MAAGRNRSPRSLAERISLRGLRGEFPEDEQILRSGDEIATGPHFACIGVSRRYELPALRGGS